MKRFLLIAGDSYYPCSGTGDWLASFDTREELPVIKELGNDEFHNFLIEGYGKFDWHVIVDTHQWISNESTPNAFENFS